MGQPVDQGLFKAQILKSLQAGEKNSQEIFEHITTRPFSYQSGSIEYLDVVYKGTIKALRVELVYLRKHGFITKTNKTRLLNYKLTQLGKQHVATPFKFLEIFNDRVEQEVKKRTADIEPEIVRRVGIEVQKIKTELHTTPLPDVQETPQIQVEQVRSNMVESMENRAHCMINGYVM